MNELSPSNRPLCASELAQGFALPLADLRRLLRLYDIRPACRVGRMPVFGPVQIRQLDAALQAEAQAG